ncbi:YL1-domain-containing protein [Patellaria atrata CBS 101060]|uniref:YL1-domain-containing protein n=1 Tax=Patellaria atrata CBS 101060 TaxID=1346257 RepID=A0A9P4S1E9_9PEZI|nr:YL1-domain-containing protein [Patellaria atrata CBS 101060]
MANEGDEQRDENEAPAEEPYISDNIMLEHDEPAPIAAASSSSEDEEEEPSMVRSRARRANAGNRMATLIGQVSIEEEAIPPEDLPEEMQAIFAEVAEDDEFEVTDVEEDIALESSGDEREDEGDAEQDEEAGERELKKLERAEKLKKRKAGVGGGLFQQAKRKKVKIAPELPSKSDAPDAPSKSETPTIPVEPESRPRKKSERTSYLPTDGLTARSSSRTLTVKNKQETYKRIESTEVNRRRILANMEAAEKRKEANKPKAMTQADRLARAARVEEENRHSLSHWEESERRREEEQRARLEALKNRKLDGPFIRFWSGPAVWINDKVKHIGGKACSKAIAELRDEAASIENEPPDNSPQAQQTQNPSHYPQPPTHIAPYPSTIMFGPPQGPPGFLDGIHYWASLPPEQRDHNALYQYPPGPPLVPPAAPQATQPPLPPRKTVERAIRNMISLQNFDDLGDAKTRDREPLLRVLFEWQKGKLCKTTPTPCAITALPARYLDPQTGLAYHDAYAYKCICRLVAGKYQWSNLLGAFVGPAYDVPLGGRPAYGVPERFWKRDAKGAEGKQEEAVGKMEVG